jgi:hypothetical protein
VQAFVNTFFDCDRQFSVHRGFSHPFRMMLRVRSDDVKHVNARD